MTITKPGVEPLAALAGFQQAAVKGMRGAIVAASGYRRANPNLQREVAAQVGVVLLEAPTGSGKTLMLGRALECLRGSLGAPCVWFWFAPFAGLVAQTRDALATQCPSLRLRDLSKDRNASIAQDGDVYVQTWALPVANNMDARKVRTRTESAASLDDMLEELRERGVRIGVVIDEAHLNFGSSARAAAKFYTEVLRPDVALLATATPNDEKLIDFEKRAGVAVANRVVVSRQQAVAAGLNKRGLQLGVIRLDERDAKLIEPEMAALTAAWRRHEQIKRRLEERGIGVVPLMLVQVEDEAKGGEDPVKRVRERLREIGVPDAAIASHTSGQPDPEFHTLAYDPSREVLIFKVAVATGFDAPRAWTLVSVRPNRGVAFGLQIVGRIMRVHPAVRSIHGQDEILDRGWVFLSDPTLQAGLDAAAAELKAVESSIRTIADELQVLEFSSAQHAALIEAGHQVLPHAQSKPTDENRQMRLENLIRDGLLDEAFRASDTATQDRVIVNAEWRQALGQTPLFGRDLPTAASPAPAMSVPVGAAHAFPIRLERGVPPRLLTERMPTPEQMDGAVVEQAARELFRRDQTPVDYIVRVAGRAQLSLRDLFLEDASTETLNVRMSAGRIAEAAQSSFEFNPGLSSRALKQALIAEFARVAEAGGVEASVQELRRALDLYALNHPDAIPDAVSIAQASAKIVVQADFLPELELPAGAELLPSRLGAYGVFPANMNSVERGFAEWLDGDETGRVRWWLRLKESTKWSPKILLPTGDGFYPDFAVGVQGRDTPDHIALVETKDDGWDGRLHSDLNREKIKAQHRDYRRVAWTFRQDDGKWVDADYDGGLDRIVPRGVFTTDTLVRLV